MSKGEMTRRRIIAEAAPIFNRRGYEGCSMQDVMEATGLEKGGLYRHFSSKEELAVAAFRYSLAQARKTRTEGLEHIPGSIPKLEHFIRRFIEEPSPLPGGCPLLNTAVDADDGNPALRRLVKSAFQDWKMRISAVIEQGIRSGEIRRGTNAASVANTIIAALEGALVLSRIEGTREPLQDAGKALGVLLAAIAAPAAG